MYHYPFYHQAYYQYYANPYIPYPSFYQQSFQEKRQQTITGKATWTTGGQITSCGIPWSKNHYMTVAVGETSPFKCGQTLKITNLSTPVPQEVKVTVVDEVRGYGKNKINLHQKAFEALGSPTSVGVIDVKISPAPQQSPPQEYAKWGKTLLNMTKNAYPNYNVVDYDFVDSEVLSEKKHKETFEFILQSGQQRKRIRANVIFNPSTDEIISVDFQNQ